MTSNCQTHRLRCIALLSLIAALGIGCSGGASSSPTAPSPATPTRTINITGSLDFGQVAIGASQSSTLTIANSGNSTLTVSGISATGDFVSQSAVSWTGGQIAASSSQTVTVTFRPTAAGSFNGTLTVTADHTGGTNTIAFTASSTEAPGFAGNWSGSYVVERCEGTGSLQDVLCSAPSGSRAGGVFPVGSSLPITMNFTQDGGSVSGSLALGNVIGTGAGAVTNGSLTLQGTARSGTLTAVISQWSTQVQGNSMSGTASYNVTLDGVSGVGVLVTRLSNVRK